MLEGFFLCSMRLQVEQIPVDVSSAESERFRSPLLLLHGLWTGSWIWQPLAGYLANRGWEVWAPSFLEAGLVSDWQALASGIERIKQTLPSPPILVAHDTAGVFATLLADVLQAPALVAIAPLVAPADAGERGIFAWPRFWTTRVWGRAVEPPTGPARRAFLGPLTGKPTLLSDSGPGFRALASSRLLLPKGVRCPGLVLGGTHDTITTPAVSTRIAARFGWRCSLYQGRGHFPMLEPGWEVLASDLHRWLVQTLGTSVILFDEGDGPEPEGP